MINKIIYRFVGLLAAIVGIVLLYQIITELTAPSSRSLITTINGIVIAWIALFGGYQVTRLHYSGKKLLSIYFMLSILVMVVIGIIFAWVNKDGNLWIEPSSQPWALIYTSYFVFSILALISLLRKDSAGFFEVDIDTRQSEIIGKVLSQLAPGLGRAFLGNVWAGLALFIIYSVLISGKFYMSINFIRSYPLSLDILFDLVVWRSFAWIDWEYVKNTIKPHEDETISAVGVYSEHKSG